jgi:hypothetical protein
MSTRNVFAVLLLTLVSLSPARGGDFSKVMSREVPKSGPVNGRLTQADLEATAAAVVNGDPLSSRQQFVVQRFTRMVRAKLSPPSRKTLDGLETRIHQKYQSGTPVSILLASVVTPGDPDVRLLEEEMGEIVRRLPKTAKMGSKSRQSTAGEYSPMIPLIWAWTAVAACDFAAVACVMDVEGEWEDCMMGVLCNEPKIPSALCCDQKAQDDLINCVVTCGMNRADNDYGRCCYGR